MLVFHVDFFHPVLRYDAFIAVSTIRMKSQRAAVRAFVRKSNYRKLSGRPIDCFFELLPETAALRFYPEDLTAISEASRIICLVTSHRRLMFGQLRFGSRCSGYSAPTYSVVIFVSKLVWLLTAESPSATLSFRHGECLVQHRTPLSEHSARVSWRRGFSSSRTHWPRFRRHRQLLIRLILSQCQGPSLLVPSGNKRPTLQSDLILLEDFLGLDIDLFVTFLREAMGESMKAESKRATF